MPERQLWMSGPLTGGRNTRDARGVIAPNESDDDLNVAWTKFGSLTRRNGFRRIIPDTFTNGVRGLFRYVNKEEGKYILIQGDDKLISYKGDDYPYYDRQELASGLSVVERHFVQMNDWAYMSSWDVLGPVGFPGGARNPRRYNRRWVRRQSEDLSKSDLEGVVRNMGLRSLRGGDVAAVPSTATGGLAFTGTGSPEYFYKFSYQFYELGEGRFTPWFDGGEGKVSGAAGNNRVTLTINTTGGTWQEGPTDAKEIRIYRTLHASTGATNDGPFYFIGTTQPGNSVYVDTKADSDLVDPSPLQPIHNDWTFPLFKLMCLHQNRVFIANTVEVTDSTTEQSVHEVDDFPYRIYYSDLYQPDRLMGFIDMPTRAPINAIISFYDQLVILQPSVTLVLTGTGPSNFVLRTVDGQKGCVAPRSVMPHGILENHVISLSGDGYTGYNGSSVKRISEAIRNDLTDLSNDRQALACGAAHKGTYRASIVREE